MVGQFRDLGVATGRSATDLLVAQHADAMAARKNELEAAAQRAREQRQALRVPQISLPPRPGRESAVLKDEEKEEVLTAEVERTEKEWVAEATRDLSASEQQEVAAALRASSRDPAYVVCGNPAASDSQVTGKDFKTLDGGRWLTDEVIR